MSIKPIGISPNFTGKAKTEKGNEYQTCNTGKFVGGGLGAALGGYNIFRTTKTIDQAMDQVKEFSEQIKDEIKAASKEEIFDLDRAFNKSKKISKNVAIVIASISALITTGIGVLAGKLYDNKQNEKREIAADSPKSTEPVQK